ncbi:MAG: site-2 protease family protein [Actinomycetota bacterium]|nr:site-2 protease family protein [Actinomycetota bacterium]
MTTVEQAPGHPEPAPDPDDTDDQPVQKLLRLGAVAAALIAVSVFTGAFPVVAFVIAVIAIVMIHELGHFITAKRAGMKVTEYFLGFGPRLWSVRRGETEYGIKAIPLGGYVKIIGMSNMEKDIDPADEPRTFRQGSYPARMIVLLAGVLSHFVIAFLLLMLLWTVVGVPNADKASVASLELNSPAQQGGFRVGDRLVSVDGKSGWRTIRTYLRNHPGQALKFVVDRDGKRILLTATPAETNPAGERVGFLGVAPKPTVEKANPFVGVARSGEMLADMSWLSVKSLASFFSPSSLESYANLVVGNESKVAPDSATAGLSTNEKRPVSLVGVGRLAGQAAETGAFEVIILLVLLNVFLGILNVVPLLPLDGGHAAIATYERIRSRRGRRYYADVQKMMPFTAAFLALLVVLGMTSIYLDIFNPIANPFR